MSKKIDFASKRKTVDVVVEELDGHIFTLRALSIDQIKDKKERNETDTINELALAIIDKETGERIYTTDEDVKNLSEMSITVFGKLVDAMKDLHGISKKAVDEAQKK